MNVIAASRRRRAEKFLYPALLLCVFALALALRLPTLSLRPMHADEAVHAAKFAELWQTGDYRYDPNEFHGPTLYDATLPILTLKSRHTFAETQASDYRLIPALFGAGIVLLLPLFADALGSRRAVLMTSVLFAVSPAFVFYSDYYIQEVPFVAFTLAAAACAWRYRQRPRWVWVFAVGACLGLAIATKETVVLTFVAAAIAGWVVQRWPPGKSPCDPQMGGRGISPITIATLTALLLAAFLLTDRFAHPAALLDYVHAFAPWIHRGTTTELHQHPWHYYLDVLFWSYSGHNAPIFSEVWILLLATVGIWAAFARQGRALLTPAAVPFLRFVSLYTLILTIVYSAIPYKTPWCVLSFLSALILLAGAGGSVIWYRVQGRVGKAVVATVLLIGTAQLAWQAHRDTSTLCADSRNPYVYAGTAPEVVDLVSRLDEIAADNGYGTHTTMQVCVKDGYYWPLPWYLRRYIGVGYWAGNLPPTDVLAQAPIVIGSMDWDDVLAQQLSATHLMTGYYGLRIGVPVEVWVRRDCWQDYLKRRKPTLDKEE